MNSVVTNPLNRIFRRTTCAWVVSFAYGVMLAGAECVRSLARQCAGSSSRRMLFQLIGTVSSSVFTLIVIPAIYAVVSASACRSSRHLF